MLSVKLHLSTEERRTGFRTSSEKIFEPNAEETTTRQAMYL